MSVMHIIIRGYPLIKFGSAENIARLQSGSIYMRSLECFRQFEAESGDSTIGDLYDGLLRINQAIVTIPELGISQELNNEALQTTFSNDFAFCMFGVKPEIPHFSFSEEQKEKINGFGESALLITDKDELITDKDEFIRRIFVEMESKGFQGLKGYCGFVKYYDETVDSADLIVSLLSGMHNVAFWKRSRDSYQQEYRLLFHAENIGEDHIEINIGDIRDISQVFSTTQMLTAISQPHIMEAHGDE